MNPPRLSSQPRLRQSPIGTRNFFTVQLAVGASDVLLIQIALVGAFWIRMRTPLLGTTPVELGVDHLWSLIMATVTLLYIFKTNGLYRAAIFYRRVEQTGSIVKSVTLAMIFLIAITFTVQTKAFVERRSVLAIAWLILVTSEIVVRGYLFPPIARRFLSQQRLLILGTGECAQHLVARFPTDGVREGLEIVGFLCPGPRPDDSPSEIQGFPILGGLDNLEEVVATHNIEQIFIADLTLDPERILEMIARCRQADVEIRLVRGMFEPIYPRIKTEFLGPISLLRLRRRPAARLRRTVKRAIDIIGSGSCLLLISPILLLISALIKVSSRGPVFFVQERAGQHGRTFRFLKFRTMRTGSSTSVHQDYMKAYIQGEEVAQECSRTDQAVNKIVDDSRITWIGQLLRRFSLDELPQLFNVLGGQMSLVGPRPPIPYEVDIYRDWHKKRLDAIPGITGLWQVSGRNRLSFEEMVLLDLFYVENWSLGMDLRILLRTLPVVLFERSTY